jgi:ABC-type dipeptide/oligopeptide/nickel transport system permease subunit
VSEVAASSSQGVSFAGPTTGGAIVWRRFRRDPIALSALVGLALIVFACFVLEPILEHVLGHGPDEPFPHAADPVTRQPVSWFSWVTDNSGHGKTFFLLGGDGPLGRDEFMRVLAGGRVSLEIAFIATAIALLIGVVLGTTAGYYGGVVDGVVSRVTELFMSFPLLLLVIALGQTVADRFEAVTLHGLFEPGVLALAVVIGLFCWFYPARVVRTLIVSLREQEFVEAAHMVGAKDRRVIRRELLPHLSGPLIVWGTLVAAGVIVLEASLSVLNFGVRLGTASWGSLLASAWGTLLNFNPNNFESGLPYHATAVVKFAPSVALFVTVLCLALIGDGLRSALDNRGER